MRTPPYWRLLLLLLVCSPLARASVSDAVRVSTWGQKIALFPGTLGLPTAIAVDASTGEVITVESARIQKWTRDGTLVASWFCLCQGVEVNEATHHVYATSWTQDAVLEFDASGSLVRQWGSFGNTPGKFNEPFGISVDPGTGTIYVGDSGNQRVQVFDPTGTFLREIRHGDFLTFAGDPMSVAFDSAARVLWVTVPSHHMVLKFNEAGSFLFRIGTPVPSVELGNFRWPRSVAIDRDGRAFVTDTDSERIQYFTPDGLSLGVFQGPNNTKDGAFHPRDIAINRLTGEIYALAAYANRVDRFDSDLHYLSSFGQPRMDGARFLLPRGIAVSPINGDIFIADTGNFVLKRATAGGAVIGQWSGSWNIDHGQPGLVGSLAQSALAVDPDGNVWAGYNGIHYPDDPPVQFVQRFDPSGNHLSSFFRASLPYVYFELAIHMAIDSSTRQVWVTDTSYKAVRHDVDGRPIEQLSDVGNPVGIALHGEYVYVADRSGYIHKFDGSRHHSIIGAPGSGPAQLSLADSSGMAIDADGNIYIADSLNNRIQEFAPDGTPVGSLGTFGNGVGQFNQPRALAFSPDFSLLHVVEYATHRVQSFCMPGFTTEHCNQQLDADSDGVLDGGDNCPFAQNPVQLNHGGVAATIPDDFGDACQCGAVDGDGIVGIPDVLALRRYLSGGNPIDTRLCNVYGNGDCNLVDAVVVARTLAGKTPAVNQLCEAAQRP